MIHVITLVGILICLAAIAGLVIPTKLTQLASRIAASERLKVAATVSRLVFGGIAILVSNATPYPLAMKIIGVIAIMAGTTVAFVNTETLTGWVESVHRNPAWTRSMSVASLLLGGFLIHATL